MNRPDAVYNLTRRKLLNDKLSVTDCASQPLKLLNLVVNGLGLDSESGLWLVPLRGAPGLPRVFPFDLIYLDKDYRVLDTAEVGPGIEFPSYGAEVASALVVPQHTLNLTGTLRGDRLMICPVQQLETLLDEGEARAARNRKPFPATTPVSPAAVQAQSPVQLVPSAIHPSVQASSNRSGSDEATIARKEARRFLYERVEQTEPDRPLPNEAVRSHSPAADPGSRIPSPQKATLPDGREGQTRAPQRVTTPKPLRSTTTFATSSLPMWHVSESTAITHGSGSIQDPKSPASRTEFKPSSAPQLKSNGSEVRLPKPADESSSSSMPSLIGSPKGIEAIPQGRRALQDLIASQPTRPIQDAPGTTWPKTTDPSVALAAEGSKAKDASGSGAAIIERASKPDRSSSGHFARPDTRPPSPNTLRSRFRQWFTPSAQPSDRRRAERRYIPGVVAHYFNGGAPTPHSVADISLSGFYLLTEDRWMPGTMIQMTMQRPSTKGERRQTITVLSRIVRRGSDGVGAEFVTPESIESHSHDIQPSQATDRGALARFL